MVPGPRPRVQVRVRRRLGLRRRPRARTSPARARRARRVPVDDGRVARRRARRWTDSSGRWRYPPRRRPGRRLRAIGGARGGGGGVRYDPPSHLALRSEDDWPAGESAPTLHPAPFALRFAAADQNTAEALEYELSVHLGQHYFAVAPLARRYEAEAAEVAANSAKSANANANKLEKPRVADDEDGDDRDERHARVDARRVVGASGRARGAKTETRFEIRGDRRRTVGGAFGVRGGAVGRRPPTRETPCSTPRTRRFADEARTRNTPPPRRGDD